jgi:hypothetical protein
MAGENGSFMTRFSLASSTRYQGRARKIGWCTLKLIIQSGAVWRDTISPHRVCSSRSRSPKAGNSD